jgi:hypothetical protein
MVSTTNCALRLKFQSKRKLKKSKHTLLTFGSVVKSILIFNLEEEFQR